MEKKALGKGLKALLPEKGPQEWRAGPEVQELSVEKIIPNRFQPRKSFEESDLIELAESVKENGVLQPILVRRIEGGTFELIAGERRWRAAKMAGLSSIPCLIRPSNDQNSLAFALTENLQRENLNPMEEARAFSRLLTEFGLTQELIAQAVGKDRSSIANILRLVSLPIEIQQFIESGQLNLGHAKVLAGLQKPEEQIKVGRQIVAGQLSVRRSEQLVGGLQKKASGSRASKKTPLFPDIEERIRKRFGTKASITKAGGKGQIIIHFFSDEDLGRILDILFE